jgi:hypothetical protein
MYTLKRIAIVFLCFGIIILSGSGIGIGAAAEDKSADPSCNSLGNQGETNPAQIANILTSSMKNRSLQEKEILRLNRMLTRQCKATAAMVVLAKKLINSEQHYAPYFKLDKNEFETGEIILFNPTGIVFEQNHIKDGRILVNKELLECFLKGVYIHHNEYRAYIYDLKNEVVCIADVSQTFPQQGLILLRYEEVTQLSGQ